MKKTMTKAEINIEIAKYYGFTSGHPITKYMFNDAKFLQWSYPKDFYMAQGCIPNFDIPDFLTMLDDYMALWKKHAYGGLRDDLEPIEE